MKCTCSRGVRTGLGIPLRSRLGCAVVFPRRVHARTAEPESPAQPAPSDGAEDEVKYKLQGPGERFKVGKGQLGDVLGASAGIFLRAGMGTMVAGYSPSFADSQEGKYSFGGVNGKMLYEESQLLKTFNRPEQPIVVYEFNACPFCKKVREMASYLDLDVEFRPCPKDGMVFRPEVIKRGGKARFPYMVDPNTGTEMYESDDIIKYLANTYGNGTVPLQLRLGPLTALTAGFSALPRLTRGSRYQAARMPEKPLVLWAYEPSPFCIVVREKLTELEIPHILRNAARGSPKRDQMLKKYGQFQVPLLEDPNTKVAIFESAAILKYLDETYAKMEVTPA